MTTNWNITRNWEGETVAVLASGPSLTQAAADDLAQHRCIAVNYSFLRASGADMLVALDADAGFWARAAEFKGTRVCGVAVDEIDALYAGPRYERIVMGPNNTIEIRNSGLAAIRIAAQMGAARIILVGFDPDVNAHFDGRPKVEGEPAAEYTGLSDGLAALTVELAASGVVVEHYLPPEIVVDAPAPAASKRAK